MKKLIVLAFFAVGLQWVTAQNTGFYHDNCDSEDGIVRDNIVYYEETGGRCYFAYTPSSVFSATVSVYNRVQIPEKWYVRDFRVVDGVAYFCGVDNEVDMSIVRGC